MNYLYIKLHPGCISWLVNNELYGIIPLSSNLIDNGVNIKNELFKLAEPNKIIIEKPFLKLMGPDSHKLAEDIIHVQRNFGMLLYILYDLFKKADVEHISSKTAREKVYNRDYITKDTQLSEAVVLLKNVKNKNYTPLHLLCLHDVLVLKKYRSLNSE